MVWMWGDDMSPHSPTGSVMECWRSVMGMMHWPPAWKMQTPVMPLGTEAAIQCRLT